MRQFVIGGALTGAVAGLSVLLDPTDKTGSWSTNGITASWTRLGWLAATRSNTCAKVQRKVACQHLAGSLVVLVPLVLVEAWATTASLLSSRHVTPRVGTRYAAEDREWQERVLRASVSSENNNQVAVEHEESWDEFVG
jgi:hypothetical protein